MPAQRRNFLEGPTQRAAEDVADVHGLRRRVSETHRPEQPPFSVVHDQPQVKAGSTAFPDALAGLFKDPANQRLVELRLQTPPVDDAELPHDARGGREAPGEFGCAPPPGNPEPAIAPARPAGPCPLPAWLESGNGAVELNDVWAKVAADASNSVRARANGTMADDTMRESMETRHYRMCGFPKERASSEQTDHLQRRWRGP